MTWPRISGLLSAMMIFCGMLASCSNDDGLTTPLPDGKYPLQLTAEVEQPQTRTGGKDAWTGGEEIRVSMEGVFGNKTYVIDASGNALPKDADNTFYWKNTDEVRISAWTLNLETGETDISDQSEGYAAFDVLYASTIGRYDQAVNLRFIHRMAKIEVSLKAGEGVTEEELNGATVTIYGDPITHSTCGLVSPGNQSDGEIKPYYDAATKKYEALVPPQNMTGKPLIRVNIGSSAFIYTPDTEAAGNFSMFGGKRYAYTITVKANGIDVQAVTSATWKDGGELDVTSKMIRKKYAAEDLKIGDYFYSDGTWSDGGLRKIYFDGSIAMDTYKPAPLRDKTVVGIVFQTDKSRIGKKEKEKLGGESNTHGLVMAVKNANASETVIWRNESRYLDLLNDCVSKSDNYYDISGYGNCESIRSLEGNFDNYPALKAVDDYNTTCPVPATTTGWYLPSSGQWWDILQNLGGCPALADGYQQTSTDINEFFWSEQGNVPAALNNWMGKINGWDKFSYYHKFWTSSKYKGSTMRYWVANSDDGWISCRWGNANFELYVRPVLAF